MFKRHKFLSGILAALVMVCGAVPLYSQQAQGVGEGDRVCFVRGIVGDVKIRRNPIYNKVRRERAVSDKGSGTKLVDSERSEWSAARLNMSVREKDEIITGPQSEIRIETQEGTMVKLGENSHLEVAVLAYGDASRNRATAADKRDGVTNTKFKVNDGSVVANINKLVNNKSSMKFETPTATAAIRGTVVEFEVKKGGVTEIKVFDGKVEIAPVGSNQFVEVKHGKMVEVAPKQKAVVVKEVPKEYKRKTVLLKDEKPPAPVKETKAAPKETPAAEEPATVSLTLDLGGEKDTVKCYARDSITIAGQVRPPKTKVSVNGVAASPDSTGAFKVTIAAPADSGVYPITIVADGKNVSETVIRTMKVNHVHTTVKLTSPAEGLVIGKPSVTVSGTALPGSKVNVEGVTIEVKRDGTFSGEVPLPNKEGNIKIQVEIVSKDNYAVWIERNIIYRKKK